MGASGVFMKPKYKVICQKPWPSACTLTRSSIGIQGTSWNTAVGRMLRMCNIWLCFRLCSSAGGTVAGIHGGAFGPLQALDERCQFEPFLAEALHQQCASACPGTHKQEQGQVQREGATFYATAVNGEEFGKVMPQIEVLPGVTQAFWNTSTDESIRT